MATPEQPGDPEPEHRDNGRVAIPLDPVDALRALLQVDPSAPPAEGAEGQQGTPESEPQGNE